MPRKKIVVDDKKIPDEENISKPKRTRRKKISPPEEVPEEKILTDEEISKPKRTRRKKISPPEEVSEEKILTDEEIPKPKRTRRKKISQPEKNSEEKILTDEEISKPKRTRRKKISPPEEIPEEKNLTDEKISKSKGGLANTSAPPEKVDYKNDGNEKIFALDIGTRSVIGIVAKKNSDGKLSIIATRREEHETRAMLDGQIHDVPQVAAVINQIRSSLEKEVGELKNVAVAAAGRALYTMTATAELEIHGVITPEQQSTLDFSGVQLAQSELAASHSITDKTAYYCVGFSVISYELDGVRLKSLIGQRGKIAKAKVIATFLPGQVIDSMQSALKYSKLDMKALTLEPIAAINVLIPPTMRHLNLVLVDIGAGTSDVAITKNGSVIAYGMVPVAGDEITEAISQKFLLDFNVAESVKRKASVGERAEFNDILGMTHDLPADEIISPITENITHLAQSISKTILELNGGEIPQAVMLVGGGALTPNLQKYVAESLKMPEIRVGVRKPDVVDGLTGVPKELCLPDAVTPLGILKIASGHTLHFLSVTVNGEDYSLFHFRRLKVSDALLNAGIQLRKWNGKPGLGLMVTIDGEKKFFPGSMGTPAKLTLNGEPATLETEIENHAAIKVEHGEDGISPALQLSDVVKPEEGFNVFINGKETPVTPKLTVNDEVSLPTRLLKDGDEIRTIAPRTIGEVLRLAGYPPTGKKIHYKLNGKKSHYTCTPEILLDEGEVQISLPIHAGDKIEYIAKENPKVSDIISISGINSSVKIFYNGKEFEIPTRATIDLTVNGRPATMNTLIDDDAEIEYQKTDQKSVIVSDALLAVNFTPPDPKSRMTFEIKVNGRSADFADSLNDGDKLEIILKTPDGVELKDAGDKEITVGNLNETTLPGSDIPSGKTPMRELTARRKLTIQDFIRND